MGEKHASSTSLKFAEETEQRCARPRNCKKSFRLPAIKNTTNASEDEWIIKSLPDKIIPNTKPSPVIQAYYQKRKQEHDALLEKKRRDMKAVNAKIKCGILHEIRIYNGQLEEAQETVSQILAKVNEASVQDSVLIEKGLFDAMLDKISEVSSSCLKHLEAFAENLRALENERIDRFKGILRDSFAAANDIYYILPSEILAYFDQEILRINQITLNNHHFYIELRAQLKLQIHHDALKWFEIYEDCKANWRNVYVNTVLRKFSESMIHELSDELTCEHPYTMQQDIEKMESKYTLITEKEDVIRWRNMKQYILDSLDLHAQNIIAYQKMAVTKIFTSVFDELGHVTKNLVDAGLATKNSIDTIYRAYQPTFYSIREKYFSGFCDKEELWLKVIQFMRTQIKQCYVFLANSTCLWDNHQKRMKTVQELIIEDLNYTFSKNDSDYNESGIKLNAMMDIIRTAADEDDLNRSFSTANKMLQSMEQLCIKQCEAELLILDKFEYFLDTELIQTEIDRFLKQYPQYSIENHHFLHKKISNVFTTERLPIGMEQCKYEITSINNWMFGVWETIFKYKDAIEARTLDEFRSWRELNAEKILKRKELKLVIINKLYCRIKMHIFEIRLAEIVYIRDRFTRHHTHVDEEMRLLRLQRDDYERAYLDLLTERNSKVDAVGATFEKLTKYNDILNTIAHLNGVCLLYKEKEQELAQKYQKVSDYVFNKCKKCNSDFHRSIRLFSENGMFSTKDAMQYSKLLKLAEKSIVTKFKAFQKETIVRQMKHTKDLEVRKDKIVERMLTYKEEYAFIEKMSAKNDSVQIEITSELSCLKQPIQLLEKYVERFRDLGVNNAGIFSYLQQYVRNYADILDFLAQTNKLLTHPIPVTNALNFTISALSSKSKSTKSGKSSSTKESSAKSDASKSKGTKSTKSAKSAKGSKTDSSKPSEKTDKSDKSSRKTDQSIKSNFSSVTITTLMSRRSRRSTRSSSNPYRSSSLKTTSEKSELAKSSSGKSQSVKSKSGKSTSNKSRSTNKSRASQLTTKSSSKSAKTTSTKSLTEAEKVRFMQELFSKPPTPSAAYLNKIYVSVYNYFNDAIDFSKEFYDGRNSLLEKNKLKPTFEEFVADLTNQCKQYLMQSETIWLDLCANLLRLINELANFANNFFNESLLKNFKANVAAFEGFLSETTGARVAETRASLAERYLGVHTKLKPLHGHPNNFKLLEALEEEFYAVESHVDCESVAHALKQELYVKMQEMKAELNSTYETLRSYNGGVCAKFIDQLLFTFIDIKRKLDIFVTTSIEEEEDMPRELEGKMTKYLENLRIMNLDLGVVAPELLNLGVNELFNSKSKITLKPLKVMEMEVEFDKKYNEGCVKIEQQMGEIEEIHEKYKRMWFNDVEKIKKLYLVKYTLPERF